MKKNHENFKVGRIMIVDDEVELMTALCEALAGQGYETMGFTTGADALKVLVEQDYDLLLTDLMMPEMDGIALLQAGLEIDPNLVGIIMTGHGTVQTAVEAMKTGAFDYVLKPFKLGTLLPLLSRAMEVRSLRMENIQLRETVAIHELGKVIAFSSDLNAILNKVADATLQQCTADEVSIMLPTRDGKELYVAVSRGGHREYIGERVPMERGIAGWVARNRETVIINGKVDDPRFSPINPRNDIRAAVSMPMLAGGNLVGVLNVNVTRSHRHMTLGQVKALSILVSIIAPILENTWLNIQIRQAEEKYRSIFENATEGIYQTTLEGQFVTANTAMATLLGYNTPEELISTVTDIAGQLYVNPEERTKLIQMIEECGQVNTFETRFYRKDGRMIWVSINIRAVCDKKGELLNYDAIAEDITERKEAEKQIRRQSKLLAAINSVFFETLTADSEETVARTCLRVAQEITDSKFGFIGEIIPEGLFKTTALSDLDWEACRIPKTDASVLIKDMVIRGIWGQVLLKEQSLLINDLVSYPDRVGLPEGHPPLTSFLGIPLKDQGKVIGMIAMANNASGYTADQQQDMEAISVAFVEVIRRKQGEEKIRQLNTELEQRVLDRTAKLEAANKELETFSYSVSHDLRAPLRSIDGFSQALLEEYQEKLDETGKTYLERVRKATQRMGWLIDDMLKLSQVTRSDFHHEAVDLSEMVRVIAKANQQNNPDRAVAVVTQEGIIVQGDPYLMQIALENLLDNAWKFTSNAWHPRIEFGRTVKNGEVVYFIRDNGVGFDMAYVGKLFGVFQRLHTTHEFPGTGIGLATVQRVIHRHGGRVWAEGEVGKGATFYFTLPS